MKYLSVKLGLNSITSRKRELTNHVWCHMHFSTCHLHVKWSKNIF